MVRYLVGEAEAEQRLDRALAGLAGVARSQARRWIDAGFVQLNDAPARASQKVTRGDRLDAEPPAPAPPSAAPEPLALSVVHEDADLLVLDKAAGLVVHPAPGSPRGTLVNALLHHCHDLSGVGGVLRPGIVHRLDRGTSGLMVVAKNDAAHTALSEQFRHHTVERVYLAFVRGIPGEDTGRVDRAIGRHRRDRKRMSVATERGRAARTAWRVVRRFPRSGAALLEVRPETGRTHQIRVHLATSGLPILGDPIYGRASKGAACAAAAGLARPALHAAVLGFTHPASGVRLRFEAPLPEDLRSLEAALASEEER